MGAQAWSKTPRTQGGDWLSKSGSSLTLACSQSRVLRSDVGSTLAAIEDYRYTTKILLNTPRPYAIMSVSPWVEQLSNPLQGGNRLFFTN